MLNRIRRKDYYYDKFHRGFVNTCIAATVVTGTLVLYSAYMYFTRTVPENKLQLEKKEKELLSEGMDFEDTVST